ncbi:MAG: hypothetical protein M5R36_21860 [Deltaproteobacteria bacterium]|nr:hypothetical protein [Deltaproteobacteria bacterium]
MGSFVAGAAKADITPTDLRHVYLAGFGNNRKATHVLDPLYVRCLYVSDDEREFALAVYDLIGLMTPEVVRLREAPGDPSPDHIWIACTHSHSGPDMLGLWGPTPVQGLPLLSGVDKRYFSFLTAETARVVRRAKRNARPATVAFNVDRTPKDATTWNIRDRSIMDHELCVMHFAREGSGEAIATLTNFGAHPECLWERNTGISADYLAPFHATVERSLGGISVFVNGALGGMVTPGIDDAASLEARIPFCKRYGADLAEIALRAVRDATNATAPRLEFRHREFAVPLKNDLLGFIRNFGVLDRPYADGCVQSCIGLGRLGPARFIGVPGEVLPEFGLALKKRFAGEPTFLLSVCNDELGYLLPAPYFDDDNYHYERSVSPVPAPRRS